MDVGPAMTEGWMKTVEVHGAAAVAASAQTVELSEGRAEC